MGRKEAEDLNLAIVKASKSYELWDKKNGLPFYITSILYVLYIHKTMTQREIIKSTNIPKQSISKGMHKLLDQQYLEIRHDDTDNRVRHCYLTPAGRNYARKKILPLIEIELEVADRMGVDKMNQLSDLMTEWSEMFNQIVREKQGKFEEN
ncbi:MarR family winged helix-turn-helix transcriptional regulator [Lactobacillus corticis]|uniref:MarR family transcriptional regulator n=1 Tax=Lactobacillus corticis TaxID=2201249 RepID=A0A916VI47_9LACO|nr:MarR family winged helix-turn-helix transcriptional regulator [Lactobacillus corticis]GFZ27781.1 MarR family transcriptional regulator [Lactobacillus corticis]